MVSIEFCSLAPGRSFSDWFISPFMLIHCDKHVVCFDLDHETAHTYSGGRVTSPALTLKFGPSHGQVTLSPFSLPYTREPAPVNADVLPRVEYALHIERRDAATIGFYYLAATRRQ